jgi:hypothetical protein
LHWQSISLSDLRADTNDADAAADVSLVSGKVRAAFARAQRNSHASLFQLRSFASSSSSVTDIALAPTAALVHARVCLAFIMHVFRCVTFQSQARLQEKEWKGLGSSSTSSADASGAFASLIDGLSGCAWSYESELQ